MKKLSKNWTKPEAKPLLTIGKSLKKLSKGQTTTVNGGGRLVN